MTEPAQDRIRNLIMQAVPADGSRIGNLALFRAVEQSLEPEEAIHDEDSVNAVRQRLIADGVLGKGRGRGGSVYRLDGVDGSPVASGSESASATRAQAETAPTADDGRYGSYQYDEQAVQRPDVGLQDQFPQAREPKTYRYDSSIAPELAWDESAERDLPSGC
jgi:adenine-specific DNA-methyltransferase